MVCQAEVVVAAKLQQITAVNLQPWPLSRLQHATTSVAGLVSALGEAALQDLIHHNELQRRQLSGSVVEKSIILDLLHGAQQGLALRIIVVFNMTLFRLNAKTAKQL